MKNNMMDQITNPSSASGHEPEIHKYLRATIKTKANDLHLKVGKPARVRISSHLRDTTGEIITEEKMESLILEILSDQQKELFAQEGTLDLAYEMGNSRFRLNIFRQRGEISVAARRINAHVQTFEELHLPAVLNEIADTNFGLVLVVGHTGCGKTTTCSSMIEHINKNRNCHIVTIEDPIEYTFIDQKAIVSQREIGIDVPDYELALKYLVRQDPDVVFIGELRDSITVSAAMRAAETGHLVFGTMHSANASQAIQRILGLFPSDQRELVRQSLSLGLKAVISQILIPSCDPKIDRIPAVEILLANPSVRKKIAEKKESELPGIIRTSVEEGMQDLVESMRKLIEQGLIEPREAYRFAPNKEELKMALKGIRADATGII